MTARLSTIVSKHGYLLAIVAIALSTLLFLAGRDLFAKGQWALLYLLVILLVAGAAGTRPGNARLRACLLRLELLLPAAVSHPAGARPKGLAFACRLSRRRPDRRPSDRTLERTRGASGRPRTGDGRTQPAQRCRGLPDIDRADDRDLPQRDRQGARRGLGVALRARRGTTCARVARPRTVRRPTPLWPSAPAALWPASWRGSPQNDPPTRRRRWPPQPTAGSTR